MIHHHARPALTTAQFTKMRDMGYPDGSHEWGPLEVDVRHSEWQAKQRRNAFWFTAFVVAGVVVSAWGYSR